MSNRNIQYWVIPPDSDAEIVACMEDVLETLLGLEIMDELDAVADLQELARQRWEIRAKKLGLIE